MMMTVGKGFLSDLPYIGIVDVVCGLSQLLVLWVAWPFMIFDVR